MYQAQWHALQPGNEQLTTLSFVRLHFQPSLKRRKESEGSKPSCSSKSSSSGQSFLFAVTEAIGLDGRDSLKKEYRAQGPSYLTLTLLELASVFDGASLWNLVLTAFLKSYATSQIKLSELFISKTKDPTFSSTLYLDLYLEGGSPISFSFHFTIRCFSSFSEGVWILLPKLIIPGFVYQCFQISVKGVVEDQA